MFNEISEEEMRELINNQYILVSYEDASNSIIATWKEPTSSEVYRTIFGEILQHIKAYKAEAYITDIYHQGLVATEDRKWLQSEIIKKAAKAGLQKISVISPRDVFSTYYVESLKESVVTHNLRLEVEYHQDVESALNWIGKGAIAA